MLPELCPVPVKVTEIELTLMYYFPVTPSPTLKLVDLESETEGRGVKEAEHGTEMLVRVRYSEIF